MHGDLYRGGGMAAVWVYLGVALFRLFTVGLPECRVWFDPKKDGANKREISRFKEKIRKALP